MGKEGARPSRPPAHGSVRYQLHYDLPRAGSTTVRNGRQSDRLEHDQGYRDPTSFFTETGVSPPEVIRFLQRRTRQKPSKCTFLQQGSEGIPECALSFPVGRGYGEGFSRRHSAYHHDESVLETAPYGPAVFEAGRSSLVGFNGDLCQNLRPIQSPYNSSDVTDVGCRVHGFMSGSVRLNAVCLHSTVVHTWFIRSSSGVLDRSSKLGVLQRSRIFSYTSLV